MNERERSIRESDHVGFNKTASPDLDSWDSKNGSHTRMFVKGSPGSPTVAAMRLIAFGILSTSDSADVF